MKKYVPLTPSQVQAIKNLGSFFDSRAVTPTENNAESGNKDEPLPSGYIRATDLLTNEQKEEIKKHEEKIQAGFKKYSAY